MSAKYTTVGPVRGCCGHLHHTREIALGCVALDQRAVTRGHGAAAYSDRVVVSHATMTYAQRCQMPERVRAKLDFERELDELPVLTS